jgi:hypothetical protein
MGSDWSSIINSKSIDLLREIQQRGIVRGADLHQAISDINTSDLQKLVQDLVKSDLVTVSGSITSGTDVLRSFFTVRPSAAGIVRSILAKPVL